MNKSEVLKALEWVDQTARDGDELRLAKAKLALEDELASEKSTTAPESSVQTCSRKLCQKARPGTNGGHSSGRLTKT